MNDHDLGRYRLMAELAPGGMGIVWLAEARGPGGFAKPCVVKELLPELARDPRHRAMFLGEARIAAELRHPNILQTYDVGCENGRWFMALELLEGSTLRRATEILGGKLAPALAVHIVCRVLSALEYAHTLEDPDDGKSLGIVHRDVTPQNVFLTTDGQVKLIDFGIAKSRSRGWRAELAPEKTAHGFAKGSFGYMSPDHLANAPIDRRADLFSVGVVLRELLTGYRLWGDRVEPSNIVRRLLAHDIPAFDDPAVPAALRAITDRALAPKRGDRWPTASAMRGALEGWLAEETSRDLDLEETLRGLFDGGPLATEGARVKLLRRGAASASRAPVAAPASELPRQEDPIVLPASDLETDPEIVLRETSPSWRRYVTKPNVFPLLMAIIASIAAIVSVTASGLGEDPAPIRVEVASQAPDP